MTTGSMPETCGKSAPTTPIKKKGVREFWEFRHSPQSASMMDDMPKWLTTMLRYDCYQRR